MPETQRILFTCIPNGMNTDTRAGAFKIAVVITPRLTTTNPAHDSLSFWPDWLDWPAVVAGMTWTVDIGSATGLPAVQDPPPGGTFRSDVWRALFPPATFVRGYDFAAMLQNFDLRPIVSYPAAWVNAFLRKQYVDVATTSPEAFPLVQSLTGGIGKLGMVVGNSERELLDQLESDLAGTAKTFDPPPVAPTDPSAPNVAAKEFLKAKVMFTPLAGLIPHDQITAHKEEPDIHDALTLLMEHPTLLRMLGLCVHLTVAMPVPAPPADDLVSVQARWTPSTMVTTQQTMPKTHYLFGSVAKTFQPKPRTPASATDIAGDEVKLDDPKFDLIQIDSDDAAIKSRMFADDLQRFHLTDKKLPSTPNRRSLPAMHSAGFAIVRSNRALQYHDKFGAQKVLNQTIAGNGTPALFADDLIWGIRLHVFDAEVVQWFSPMRRDVGLRLHPPGLAHPRGRRRRGGSRHRRGGPVGDGAAGPAGRPVPTPDHARVDRTLPRVEPGGLRPRPRRGAGPGRPARGQGPPAAPGLPAGDHVCGRPPARSRCCGSAAGTGCGHGSRTSAARGRCSSSATTRWPLPTRPTNRSTAGSSPFPRRPWCSTTP